MTSKLYQYIKSAFIAIVLVLLSGANYTTMGQDAVSQNDTVFKDQQAIVVVKVCSRGCYQYLIQTKGIAGNVYLYPDSIPENCKIDNLAIIFSGSLTGDSIDIIKPGIDDRPVKDFTVPKIRLDKINF